MALEHTFLGRDGPVTKTLTALKAIREKCLNCCCWSSVEVKACEALDCPLHPFRTGRAGGKRGSRKRISEQTPPDPTLGKGKKEIA